VDSSARALISLLSSSQNSNNNKYAASNNNIGKVKEILYGLLRAKPIANTREYIKEIETEAEVEVVGVGVLCDVECLEQ